MYEEKSLFTQGGRVSTKDISSRFCMLDYPPPPLLLLASSARTEEAGEGANHNTGSKSCSELFHSDKRTDHISLGERWVLTE